MSPSAQVTPPQSFVSSTPLTPPPTDEKASHAINSIITKIKERKDGKCRLTEPWVRYTLNEGQYAELLRQIQRDSSLWSYMTHKLSYHYIPSVERFVFRMPTQLHEWVISSVVEELRHQLRKLGAGQDASADFARAVDARGSPTLDFNNSGFGKHDPDAQFRHLKAKYPGVVIEVSYSQKRKDLKYIAEDYILGSDGNIRVVIGVDVEYRKTKAATLSVWRPMVVPKEAGKLVLVAEQTVVNQAFRDEKGNVGNDAEAGLCLQLQDFAPEDLVDPNCPLNAPICIPASTLFLYLQQAEQNVVFLKEQGVVRSTKPWVEKWQRPRTPPKELDDSREAKFQENERKAMAKADKDDSSYKSTSDGE